MAPELITVSGRTGILIYPRERYLCPTMKFLLLLVGTVAAVTAHPRDWPCPLEDDIYPCVCTVGTTGEPDLDCSNVTSNNILASVFQAPFPFTQFNKFTIIPDSPHGAFNTIEAFVFGEVSFKNVIIRNTYIDTIQSEAFTPSHDSLINLDCSGNYLMGFPVETLPLFIHLRILNLANNKLPILPDFESDSLLSLDLSQNIGLTITETTLVGLKQLEELYLRDMGFTSLPPNLFSTLTFLRILDLSSNGMAGTLGQGVIRVPLDSVDDLRLNDNALTQIHSSAITGLDRTAKLDFRNNQFTTLDWENWYPVLDQITGVQVVDVAGNAFYCGCDIVWLLSDSDYLDKINDSATCSDGSPLKDTPLLPLLEIC